jgi:hypothetical protein
MRHQGCIDEPIDDKNHKRDARLSKRHAQRDRARAIRVMMMNTGSLARCGSTKIRQICARVSRPKTVPVVIT